MINYEYGRIKVLATALTKAGIEQDIRDRIVESGESILKGTKPDLCREWQFKSCHSRYNALFYGMMSPHLNEKSSK